MGSGARWRWLAAILPLWVLSAALPAHAQGKFRLEAKWTIGGLGQWSALAVDPDAKDLYVARQDHIVEIDTRTGKQVGSIGGFMAARGIAFDRSGYGYVTDGASGRVVVFDRKLNRVIRAVQAGGILNRIVFDAYTGAVWAFDLKGERALAISARTQAGMVEVKLPGRPGFAVSDGDGSLYVGLEDKNEVARIDTKSRKIRAEWPLDGCTDPAGIAADESRGRIFVACGNGALEVLSVRSGKAIARLAIGKDPGSTAFSRRGSDVLVADGGGKLVVIREVAGRYSVVQNLSTLPGARIMASGPGGRIYLAANDSPPRIQPNLPTVHPRMARTFGKFVILVIAK